MAKNIFLVVRLIVLPFCAAFLVHLTLVASKQYDPPALVLIVPFFGLVAIAEIYYQMIYWRTDKILRVIDAKI
jgi:hypothetical protein